MADSDDAAPNDHSLLKGLVHVDIHDVLGIGAASKNLAPAASEVIKVLGDVFTPSVQEYLSERAAGAALRHEAIADAKAVKEIDIILRSSSTPGLAERLKARLFAQEVKRQDNIDNTAIEAIRLAQASTDPVLSRIDPEFANEWVKAVEEVSNADVQILWAKLLAKAPTLSAGRVTKPSIELFKQFDAATAHMFLDFLLLSHRVGFVSYISSNSWKELGFNIDFDRLEDLSIIEKQYVRGFDMPGVGHVSQEGGRGGLAIWALRSRAEELATVISPPFPEIDQKNMGALIFENLRLDTDPIHIAREFQQDGSCDFYVLRTTGHRNFSIKDRERVRQYIERDADLSAQGRDAMCRFAESDCLNVFHREENGRTTPV